MALKPDKVAPEEMAINALVWLAGDETLMRRFLDLSGIDASQIRQAAQEPAFLAGVLQFIVAHEPTLSAFAESSGIHAASVTKALQALPGGDQNMFHST